MRGHVSGNVVNASKLATFDFNSNSIRVVTIEGQPWFVAADACKCLGLDTSKGVYKHLEKVDDEDRRPVPPNILRGKGTTRLTVLNESGLYKLVMRSDKPQAHQEGRYRVFSVGDRP